MTQAQRVVGKARLIVEKIKASCWGSLPEGASIPSTIIRRSHEREIDLLDPNDPDSPAVKELLERIRSGLHDVGCPDYIEGKAGNFGACTCPAGKRYSQ